MPTAAAAVESRLHRRFSWLVSRPLFWVVVIGTLFALPLARSLSRKMPSAPPVMSAISTFQSTIVAGNKPDRLGASFDSSELHGLVWVASFLDPNDPRCDQLADRIALIQHHARNLGDSYALVSFVPRSEDAAKMAPFIARHHVNPRRWTFLALEGGPVEKAALDVLHAANVIAPVASVGQARVHDQHLVLLVDQEARIRGIYDLSTDTGLRALLDDMGYFANVGPQGPAPAQ
jgi:hypothetical protein